MWGGQLEPCLIRLMSVQTFACSLPSKGQPGRERLKVTGGKLHGMDNLETHLFWEKWKTVKYFGFLFILNNMRFTIISSWCYCYLFFREKWTCILKGARLLFTMERILICISLWFSLWARSTKCSLNVFPLWSTLLSTAGGIIIRMLFGQLIDLSSKEICCLT